MESLVRIAQNLSTESEHRIWCTGVQVFVCLRALKGFFLYKYTKKVDILSFFLYKNRQVYGHLNPRSLVYGP